VLTCRRPVVYDSGKTVRASLVMRCVLRVAARMLGDDVSNEASGHLCDTRAGMVASIGMAETRGFHKPRLGPRSRYRIAPEVTSESP
jgi:hypothetical protein